MRRESSYRNSWGMIDGSQVLIDPSVGATVWGFELVVVRMGMGRVSRT